MRFLAIALLTAGLAATACDRTDTAATTASGSNPVAKTAAALFGSREVTIPAGTPLNVVLDTPVGSDTSELEEAVHGHLAAPVIVEGQTVADTGSRVSGVVTSATKSGKVKGRAHVAVRFDTLQPSGQDGRYTITTTSVGRTAAATKEKDAWEIAGPAAGGALIGALVGGGKGAAIGTAVGGGAGTAVVLSTSGKEVHMPKGAEFTLRLTEPVTVKVGG